MHVMLVTKKVVGEAACTTAQQGYYTVDTIGGSTATNTAAKDEAQVPAGSFAVDNSEMPLPVEP